MAWQKLWCPWATGTRDAGEFAAPKRDAALQTFGAASRRTTRTRVQERTKTEDLILSTA